jgi:hypothetical protein
MRFSCTTGFDITATGVTGHFKSARVPFRDRAGNNIRDMTDWNRSRNQQRNWETVQQIIGMRTQISDSTVPVRTGSTWHFEFETETPGVYGADDDPVAVLYSDADGVPMLTDLDNRRDIVAFVVTQGPEQNIWFGPVTLNNS